MSSAGVKQHETTQIINGDISGDNYHPILYVIGDAVKGVH